MDNYRLFENSQEMFYSGPCLDVKMWLLLVRLLIAIFKADVFVSRKLF